MNEHQPRPRRSRQCRGSRARNFERTQARVTASPKQDYEDLQRVVAEADESGALALFRRQSKARAEHQLAKRRAAGQVAEQYEIEHVTDDDTRTAPA